MSELVTGCDNIEKVDTDQRRFKPCSQYCPDTLVQIQVDTPRSIGKICYDPPLRTIVKIVGHPLCQQAPLLNNERSHILL